jgi:neutral ceramidase
MPAEQGCHKEKVLLLPTGFAKPYSWTARVVPFQLVRIGPLVIIGAPFEITSVAGYRLKEEIKRRMAGDGVRYVALSGLANEYIHYVTTREEYAVQSYEGGSTLYGPWSLAAYTEIFANLSEDMITGRMRPAGAPPPDLASQKVVLPHGVLFDLPPQGGHFGDVLTDAQPNYQPGDRAAVAFWGAHPNNSLAPGASYLTIEHWEDGGWQTKLYDWDGQTTLHWRRQGLASSVITVTWSISQDTAAGRYRICQSGKSKAPITGSLSSYKGCSREFEVGAE